MLKLIYNYITQWFKKQDLKTKLFIVICFIGLGYLMYLGAGKAYYKYKYFKALETEITLKDQYIEELENKVSEALEVGEKVTNTVKKNKVAIYKKLKQDEEIINNSDFSDAKLDKLLAKYEK